MTPVSSSRIRVTTAESSSEPAQPRLLEKKRNIGLSYPLEGYPNPVAVTVWAGAISGIHGGSPTKEADPMGITDKITGRVKQAAGDLTGDKDIKRQGAREERKGEVKEEAQEAEFEASEKRQEAANLERKT